MKFTFSLAILSTLSHHQTSSQTEQFYEFGFLIYIDLKESAAF